MLLLLLPPPFFFWKVCLGKKCGEKENIYRLFHNIISRFVAKKTNEFPRALTAKLAFYFLGLLPTAIFPHKSKETAEREQTILLAADRQMMTTLMMMWSGDNNYLFKIFPLIAFSHTPRSLVEEGIISFSHTSPLSYCRRQMFENGKRKSSLSSESITLRCSWLDIFFPSKKKEKKKRKKLLPSIEQQTKGLLSLGDSNGGGGGGGALHNISLTLGHFFG